MRRVRLAVWALALIATLSCASTGGGFIACDWENTPVVCQQEAENEYRGGLTFCEMNPEFPACVCAIDRIVDEVWVVIENWDATFTYIEIFHFPHDVYEGQLLYCDTYRPVPPAVLERRRERLERLRASLRREEQ